MLRAKLSTTFTFKWNKSVFLIAKKASVFTQFVFHIESFTLLFRFFEGRVDVFYCFTYHIFIIYTIWAPKYLI